MRLPWINLLPACFLIYSTAAFAQTSSPSTTIAIQNARFAARLQQTILSAANQAADNIDARAQLAAGLSTRLQAQPALSQDNRQAAEAILGGPLSEAENQRPTALAARITQLSNMAHNVANQVRSLAGRLSGATPNQTFQLLSAGVRPNAVAQIFPENTAVTIVGGSIPAAATAPVAQSRVSAVDLYARAGVFSQGGPSVDFPNVALLLMLNPNSGDFEPQCTATLVASDTLVSAAHCFCPVPNRGETTEAICGTQRHAIENDEARFRVFFQLRGLFKILSYSINPAFVLGLLPNGETQDLGDVAVIKLQTQGNGIGVVKLAGAIQQSAQTRIVGFGGGFAPETPGIARIGEDPSPPGLKLWSTAALANCNNPFEAPQDLCWDSGPDIDSSSGAICPGDSGGPMLMGLIPPSDGSSEQIVGVNSASTNSDCTQHNQQADSSLSDAINKSFVEGVIGTAPQVVQSKFIFAHVPVGLLQTTGTATFSVYVDHAVSGLIISVNGFVRSQLALEVRDSSGAIACTPEGGPSNQLPSVNVCVVSAPQVGQTFQVTVHGTPQAVMQLVATGYAN